MLVLFVWVRKVMECPQRKCHPLVFLGAGLETWLGVVYGCRNGFNWEARINWLQPKLRRYKKMQYVQLIQ